MFLGFHKDPKWNCRTHYNEEEKGLGSCAHKGAGLLKLLDTRQILRNFPVEDKLLQPGLLNNHTNGLPNPWPGLSLERISGDDTTEM